MLAAYASAPNADDPLAALEVGERPDPEAPEGWVTVDVRAASLNMHDVFTLSGVGIKEEQFPMILGTDGAGTLEDGTEVVIHGVVSSPGWTGDETLDPKRSLLSERHQGAMAERVAIPAANAIPKPQDFSFAEAACLGTAWLTAYRMLFVKAAVRPGQTILVQGASGGVATALTTLAAAAGVRVWATGRSEESRAIATEQGADQTFESGERLPERVDAAFETVGAATWSHSLKSLKPGGTVVISGTTSGDASPAELQRVFFLQLRVLGSTMGTREELADLIAFCEAANIRPRIGSELPLASAGDGIASMLAGTTGGKVVFTTG